MYATFRAIIVEHIPAHGDAADIMLGWVVYLLAMSVLRRPVRDWWSAGVVAIAGLALAIADSLLLRYGLRAVIREFILFSVLPGLTTLAFRLGWAR